jgi:hypothetical protein
MVKKLTDEDRVEIRKAVEAGNVGPIERTDGTPVDAEEASQLHQLCSDKMKINFAPGTKEQMQEMGLTEDDIIKLMMASAKKVLS